MARKKQNQELSDKQRALITEFDKKSPIAEQYRTLRTNIQFAAVDRQLKTIMVTSSSPGEGKSTTIANLGIVLAQQHNRVLLVDTDLRKPTVHFTFQIPNQVGLTNVVTQQEKFDDAVFETSIPRLDVLPSGPVPPNPSELLGSRSMKEFVTSITKKYDYIVFDAPPVNAVTDPQVLSRLVDGVILVVRSGKTEEEHAKKAVEQLKKVEANLLGAVLNDREMEDSQYYYYYGEGK
ncbi:capsular biosynthesis protein [Salipaludibacillus keqinensis]|uniref:non-specific protein-tyrosine kinase n=1 Tax=Salipaludibacillus keqinensis TaxID=2045207 RepID=A0A323TAK6_9BACI|nr:CpsD/CapB family tyrosine-protein kinase [Salipaludibacillus keqinensis]PYZ92572.1 capsular biosynthesis protein [Salipaludibacillus keqinensis]